MEEWDTRHLINYCWMAVTGRRRSNKVKGEGHEDESYRL